MWLCKNRTCEFKAYKVQLSAQSEWRKLTLPGQSIYIQMKVWSVGPSDQSYNVVLSSEQPADVNFYFFFFIDWHFLSSSVFFSCFFIISLNGRSLEKQRIKIRPQSFEMWDKEVICTFKITWCVCQKKRKCFNISSRNVKLIYKEWLLCSRRENVLIVNIFWQWTNL